MDNLWQFADDKGTFKSDSAQSIKSLYFPLCNERVMSSLTVDLHGDIKSGNNSFLLEPVSRISLTSSRASRNFWVYINKDKIWSATGVSKDLRQIKNDSVSFEAGLLWQKVTRENKSIGLKAEILSFIPATNEPVEIMQVKLTNVSSQELKFTPTAAIPIYARGANNLRDHRHVTSLLQRIKLDKFGVISKPTLAFDEAGHKPNKNYFFVLGWNAAGEAAQHIYPTQDMFCGDGGDLEAPESVYENSLPKEENIQGREPMGAFRFKAVKLGKGRSVTYIILSGISEISSDINKAKKKFNSLKKVQDSFEETKKFWLDKAGALSFSTGNSDFDNWFRWVSIQPFLRKIFGCSFLPDFDYGKGGRGWRDLWQDCLGLILSGSKGVRSLLINNFAGVRVDGSNATIIGSKPGEFIADRNDICRVWMDHGIWPLITTELYIKKTKDSSILFDKAAYFCDQHVWRSSKVNSHCQPSRYQGTILEHLILENLTQFFNVGAHNHIKLEGADWNDGLDMAKENGESVAFSCMYADNLNKLAKFLRDSGREKVTLIKEIKILLKSCDYNKINSKRKILEEYFARVENGISGQTLSFDTLTLAKDLESKAQWIFKHIRKTEWLSLGFFNGYYDNNKKRVEGNLGGRVQMMLASQVFAIMSGAAEDWQVEKIIASVEKHLFDKKLGGYHLNTDFGRQKHDLGRAFSFSYGDKENGAIFSHMVVMYAYALYKRGFVKEAQRALYSLYKLSVNTSKSKIYPCLPEYFDLDGRGMYSYLTGSASWFVLTMFSFNK
jgi:cellobiose phosphorylase